MTTNAENSNMAEDIAKAIINRIPYGAEFKEGGIDRKTAGYIEGMDDAYLIAKDFITDDPYRDTGVDAT